MHKAWSAISARERVLSGGLPPENASHFGGLWEPAVKSFKSTALAQIEACLNLRPLVALPHLEDGTEALTPGHFLIGVPLESPPEGEGTLREVLESVPGSNAAFVESMVQ